MSSITLTGALISPIGAPGVYVVGEIPAGTKDGVNKSFSLANAPESLDDLGLYLTGVRLERVLVSPSPVQFTILGTAVTTGLAPRSTDGFFADYIFQGTTTPIVGEVPGGVKNGTNKIFTLASTPLTDASVGLYLTGVRLERVGSSPGNSQFTISGAILTVGLAPRSIDSLFADYLT